MHETWLSSDNLLPMLKLLHIPVLVLHGEHDFVPLKATTHISQALAMARQVELKNTGDLSYLESPVVVRKEISVFLWAT